MASPRAAPMVEASAMLAGRVTVESVSPRTSRAHRVVVSGDALRSYRPALAAEAFKLMLPAPGAPGFDFPPRGADGLPYWPPGSSRPMLRPCTVRSADPGAGRIAFDVALRPGGGTPLAGLRPATNGTVVGGTQGR